MCYHHHHLITSVVTSAAIFRKLTHVVIQLAQLSARTHTVVPNYKNPPKIKSWKFVKLTDHTCACNDLTSFVCELQPTKNGSYVNLQKLTWKNSWNHIWWIFFRRVLDRLGPLCAWVSEAAALIFGKEEKKFFYLESSSRNRTLPVVMSRQFTLLVFFDF